MGFSHGTSALIVASTFDNAPIINPYIPKLRAENTSHESIPQICSKADARKADVAVEGGEREGGEERFSRDIRRDTCMIGVSEVSDRTNRRGSLNLDPSLRAERTSRSRFRSRIIKLALSHAERNNARVYLATKIKFDKPRGGRKERS